MRMPEYASMIFYAVCDASNGHHGHWQAIRRLQQADFCRSRPKCSSVNCYPRVRDPRRCRRGQRRDLCSRCICVCFCCFCCYLYRFRLLPSVPATSQSVGAATFRRGHSGYVALLTADRIACQAAVRGCWGLSLRPSVRRAREPPKGKPRTPSSLLSAPRALRCLVLMAADACQADPSWAGRRSGFRRQQWTEGLPFAITETATQSLEALSHCYGIATADIATSRQLPQLVELGGVLLGVFCCLQLPLLLQRQQRRLFTVALSVLGHLPARQQQQQLLRNNSESARQPPLLIHYICQPDCSFRQADELTDPRIDRATSVVACQKGAKKKRANI